MYLILYIWCKPEQDVFIIVNEQLFTTINILVHKIPVIIWFLTITFRN